MSELNHIKDELNKIIRHLELRLDYQRADINRLEFELMKRDFNHKIDLLSLQSRLERLEKCAK